MRASQQEAAGQKAGNGKVFTEEGWKEGSGGEHAQHRLKPYGESPWGQGGKEFSALGEMGRYVSTGSQWSVRTRARVWP